MRGLFVTFEGGEGVGKSTQMGELARRLRGTGRDVLELHEPGGTPVGDHIRALLLDPANAMDPVAELFLYEASRAELVRAVIEPALERGAAVLCDRFTDSTLAYQGYGRGLDLDDVRALNSVAAAGIEPDMTVLLEMDIAAGLERATHGGADRIEGEPSQFHERVAAGFRAIAEQEPGRVLALDASGDITRVADAVWALLSANPAFLAWMGAPRP